jgi:hypothetical protein
MKPEKMPRMEKEEYDELIRDQYICRVAFKGEKYPSIKPFLYVFDGEHIYILSTKYGEKLRFLQKNPNVCVEIETYKRDFSDYSFVTLCGRLEKVENSSTQSKVRQMFVDLIQDKQLSTNVMVALGHTPQDPPSKLTDSEKNIVLRLTDVQDITALKND